MANNKVERGIASKISGDMVSSYDEERAWFKKICKLVFFLRQVEKDKQYNEEVNLQLVHTTPHLNVLRHV